MNRHAAAIVTTQTTTDNCLITSCLKKLFCGTAKSTVETSFVIKNHVAAFRKELELLNTQNLPELSYAYLSAMEQSIPGADFRYAVIHKSHVPVLFVSFQLYTLTSRNFNLEENKGFVKRIIRFFLDLKKVSVLISGNALRNNTLCFCFDGKVMSEQEAVEIVASIGEKIAVDERAAALIIKDIAASAQAVKWLAGDGFQTPWTDNAMVMDVDSRWTSIAGYVDALSRKYKTRAKNIMEAGKGITVKELTGADIIAYNDEIKRSFRQVADNQSFVLTHPAEGHFAMLKDIYKSGFEMTGFFRDEQLVAFSTAFVTEVGYELYYAGFDYSLNNEYQLYFNILLSGLERAITLKKQQLMLGRTSFDAKASLGAKPIAQPYYYKPGNIPNVVSNWFSNYFSAMEDGKWKLRNPLK